MKVALRKCRYVFLLCNTVFSVLFCTAHAPSAYAGGDIYLQCVQKYPGDDAARLKCYDQIAAPDTAPEPAARKNIAPDEDTAAGIAPTITAAVVTSNTDRSYLTKVWNLDDLSNRDPSRLGRIQPYRQTYMLVKRTSNPNRQPSSPLPDHNSLAPSDMDATEVKFQLSFKADIGQQRNIDLLGIKTVRFWWAYTQQSDWQAFNFRNSSPYRETVYQPELIATLGTGYTSGLKLINIGWDHQSNGRNMPGSRSLYRIYLLGGWEWSDMTSIMVRGWWRIPEDPLTDDNPDIIDYLGRGDLVVRWEPRDKSQSIALLLRNNLRSTNNHGFMQIDWATPVNVGSAARMHIQITSGYGESLIDYNHRQNTIGLGLSFREW
ncbi:MAG: phospholipase A [Gallionella sp.]